MKRIATLVVAALSFAAAHSQNKVTEFGVFDHLGADVTVGLDGVGVNLAAPVTEYLQVRAGVSIMPKINAYSTDLDYRYGTPKKDATAGAKFPIQWVNGKLLLDVYPFKDVQFRVTAGFFAGNSAIVKAYNTDPVLHDPGEGIYIGDVLVVPDDNNDVQVELRVNTFKPYVGIGYGYSVPKSRVGFTADLGAMFWGKPSVWVQGDNGSFVKASKDDFNDSARDAVNTITKFKVLPVLSLGVAVRLF